MYGYAGAAHICSTQFYSCCLLPGSTSSHAKQQPEERDKAPRPLLSAPLLAAEAAPRGRGGRALRLAACCGITDGVLAAAVPPGVRELSVVCCEAVTGWGLTRLRALRALRLDGCPAVDVAAVQARPRAAAHVGAGSNGAECDGVGDIRGHAVPSCPPLLRERAAREDLPKRP